MALEEDIYDNLPSDKPPGESPTSDNAPMAESSEEIEYPEIDEDLLLRESRLIQRARDIYRTSTGYLEANITNRWETALAHFNNEHAPGSRYGKSNYKRARTFRPKTRANIKNQEANLAAAAFSTRELVDIQPEDPSNPNQVLSAKINKFILQYRLDKRMPWFLTVMGAYQDTKNYGVCITHQYWRYREDKDVVPAFDQDGEPIYDEQGQRMGREVGVVRADDLCCDSIAPENFRFDPMCDWRDPANTSPYLIYMMPIYANEALEMMESEDPKTGHPVWRKYALSQILATRRSEYDRTRQAREGRDRVDPADDQQNEYTTVWAHMNIIRVNGEDMVYWTMGTELLLTSPMRLRDLYPHLHYGQRPFTVGIANIEAHKNYPASDNELSSHLQREINDVANQRLDNVKLALNKRYYVRRGSQVDLDALIRNVPGGGVMVNDPERDIKTVETRDVTSSSYQEQDRLSVEMDELLGGFGSASMQGASQKGAQTGAMSMASQSAGAVQDYTIRVFMETWMEPTLRQMVQLIQMYETDAVITALAARHAGVWERYGTDEVTDEMLRQSLTVAVNIGIGNTDPVRRIEKLIFSVSKTAELPGMIDRMKSTEIADEIFGTMGYKDSTRFYMTDEEFAEHQKTLPPPGPTEIDVKMQELTIRQEDNKMRDERERAKMELERDSKISEGGLAIRAKEREIEARKEIEDQKDKTARDATALKELNKSQELAIKRATGSGI